MDRFILSLPEELKEALRIKAFENRTSIAEEIRKAIDEYLRKETKNEEMLRMQR